MDVQLRCRLSQDPNASTENAKDQTFWLEQEADKKSSFLFQSSDGDNSITKIEKPCHLILDCSSSECRGGEGVSSEWLFGGLEIHSNSRNVEVYAVPEGKNLNEREYWQTHRGSIMADGNRSDNGPCLGSVTVTTKEPCEKELYQVIILPPSSKPVTLRFLHLKLLSLRPAKCTMAYVKCIKVKGRIPDTMLIQSDPVLNDHSSQTQTKNESMEASSRSRTSVSMANTQQGVSTSTDSTAQIASAVSGLTMMIQNIHQSMESSIQSTIGEFQSLSYNHSKNLSIRIEQLEKNVNGIKDGVDLLNNNVEALRKENRLYQNRHEENITAQKSIIQNEAVNRDFIRDLMKEERQIMTQEFQKEKDKMVSQLVEQLVFELGNNNFELSSMMNKYTDEENLDQDGDKDRLINESKSTFVAVVVDEEPLPSLQSEDDTPSEKNHNTDASEISTTGLSESNNTGALKDEGS